MKSRHGARLRLLCRDCDRTFCNRRGTVYYRLQTPRWTFDHFAALLSEGLSCASLARILDLAPATLLITSDPFPYYEQELKRGFGPVCTYVQVKNDYRQNKIKHSTFTPSRTSGSP